MTYPICAQEDPDKPAGATDNRMLQVAELASRRSPVIPTPRETYWGKGKLNLGAGYTLDVRGGSGVAALSAEFQKRLTARFHSAPASGGVKILFAVKPSDEKAARQLATVGVEGYVIRAIATPQPSILVAGNSESALWRGMVSLVQLISLQDGALILPEVEILDYPQMSERALLVDIGGQGYMVGPSRWELPQWKELVDWMVDHKLNSLWVEIIGSGRLMGNLNVEAGEWIGYPVALKSYPQIVAKDRPIRRWDEAQRKVIADRYTAPNVAHDFLGELIDYAQARGVKTFLFIGYDYFAAQLPVVLGVPSNKPQDRKANKVYDDILRELTTRYKSASGVVLCTIETRNVPPTMINEIIRRTNEGYKIVKSINPKMEVGLLPDYLEWQPNQLDDIQLFKKSVPPEVFLAYSPHREPQQRSWQRVHGNVWRYLNLSQYAWDHIAYVFPERIHEEILNSYMDGYRKVVTQAWYADVFLLNYLVLAEFSWNPTSGSVQEFWDRALADRFGPAAKDMRTALTHTRFDRRFDIAARMIVEDKVERNFTFWDMYVLHQFKGLKDNFLEDMENDARLSLAAAQKALPKAPAAAREMVDVVIVSAERRLYLATSARHMLKAIQLRKSGQMSAARSAMDDCLREGEKLFQAGTRLGIEFPLSVHDEKVVEKYRQMRQSMN